MTKEKAWKIVKSQFHPKTKEQLKAYEIMNDVMVYEIRKEKKYLDMQKKVKALLNDK